MKKIILFGTAVLLSPIIFAKTAQGQTVRASSISSNRVGTICDFSDYKPLKEPHILLKSVTKKVDPVYPLVAKSVGASGKVVIRVLVNKKGNITNACIIQGHPLLRAASVEAAKQWNFKENFGFIDYKPKENFAETDVIFNFQNNNKKINIAPSDNESLLSIQNNKPLPK